MTKDGAKNLVFGDEIELEGRTVSGSSGRPMVERTFRRGTVRGVYPELSVDWEGGGARERLGEHHFPMLSLVGRPPQGTKERHLFIKTDKGKE